MSEDAEKEAITSDQMMMDVLDDLCNDKTIVKDRDNNYYVQLENPVNGKNKTYSFDSFEFKDFIRVKYYEKTGKAINSSKLNDLLYTYKAMLTHQNNTTVESVNQLSNRIHGNINDGKILYDLCRETGEVVEITPEGWNIIYLDKPIFKKTTNTSSQVLPLKINDTESKDEDFWNSLNRHPVFRNIELTNKVDLFIYLITCFIPQIPKPILLLRGSNDDDEDLEDNKLGGSGKSTLIRFIKQIVDPSSSGLSSIPKDIENLKLLLSESHYIGFDNISYIKHDISDTLCQGVTGGTLSKRKLYTNDELKTLSYKNCIAINGINLRKLRADLVDRSWIYNLERIEDENIKSESELLENFESLLPELLGRIFNALSKMLKYFRDNAKGIEEINAIGLPRMADFALCGQVLYECMYNTQDKEFIEIYKKKTILQNSNLELESYELEKHAVVQSIQMLMDRTIQQKIDDMEIGKPYEISCRYTFTNLYNVLTCYVIADHILNQEEIKNPNLFPQSPNSLSRLLKKLKPFLKQKEIEIDMYRTNDAKRTKTIAFYIEHTVEPEQPNELEKPIEQVSN